MIYGINDRPPIWQLITSSFQIMLACFAATALIGNVCGMPISGALVAPGIATIICVLINRFKSPMFISNSGAFVAPVLAASAIGGTFAVFVGGITSAIVYCVFGIVLSKIGVNNLYKFMPKVLIGSITVVIGVNLMPFIKDYVGVDQINMIIALITMISIALCSHYLKGTISLFPFLIGTLIGYIISIPFGLVNFEVFKGISLFKIPTFAFMSWEPVALKALIPLIVMTIAYTISAQCECLSDNAALGGIIGKDLYREPGLARIFIGEGIANMVGTALGGLGQCSYGESIATIGFSKNASVYTTIGGAVLMIIMGFLEPVQAFISSIPTCVIGGGCAMVLYGFISSSGIKLLKDVDLNNQKNLIICSTVMSLGISGVVLGGNTFNITGTALAIVVGVILNLILKDKELSNG